MKTYAIGDIQGCFLPLQALMKKIESVTPAARYLLTGDLVNRGPQSLETLRFIRDLGDKVVTVLGNHDLHLLSIAAGAGKKQKGDSLDAILNAPDYDELIDWLRMRPIAHYENGYLLVHAGVLPQWTLNQALALAREVETVLQGKDWVYFLRNMYGNYPTQWQDSLKGIERLRCIVNGFTRLRFCSEEGEMDFEIKESPSYMPAGLLPWFEVSARKTKDDKIIFGHWSTLGLLLRENLISLDTGCVWNRQLTAICLENKQLYQADYQGRLL